MGLFSIFDYGRWPLALGGLVGYIGYKVWVYYRLRVFKGPPGSGWFELWHSSALLGNNAHIQYKEVCDKYGAIARVGPNDLITCSQELLSRMNAVRSPYTRTPWFALATRSQPGTDNIFSVLNKDAHLRSRQQMASGYSGKENLELEGTIDVYVQKLVNLIRAKYLSTSDLARSFDLGNKIQYLAIDVISSIALGDSLGDLDTDSDRYHYIKATEVGLKLATISAALGILPILQRPWVARLLGPSEDDVIGFGRVMRLCRMRIKARLRQGIETRSDMVASFVRHGMGTEQLVTEAVMQLVAGSDTTSTAIRSVILYVVTHPRVYAKLQADVDAAVADGKVPAVPGIISDVEAKNLPYMQACIKEAMRIHAPTAGLFPKRVPDGGETVIMDGKPVFLPGGINVSYARYALLLDKRVYGQDADEFRPERWLLEKDATKLAVMHRTHDLTFGCGRYQCLGKPLALMEIGKAVFELIRNFDLGLARPEQPWQQKNFLGIFTHQGMFATATDRVTGANANLGVKKVKRHLSPYS